jgi:hypothetical protein
MTGPSHAAAAAVPEPQGGCTVHTGAADGFQLPGGDSMFARVQIASGAGDRFALAGAKCERRLPARYGPAPEVPNGFGRPPVFPCRESRSTSRSTSRSGGSHPTYPEGYR